MGSGFKHKHKKGDANGFSSMNIGWDFWNGWMGMGLWCWYIFVKDDSYVVLVFFGKQLQTRNRERNYLGEY